MLRNLTNNIFLGSCKKKIRGRDFAASNDRKRDALSKKRQVECTQAQRPAHMRKYEQPKAIQCAYNSAMALLAKWL